MPIRPGPVILIAKGKYYVPIRTIHMDKKKQNKNLSGKIAFKKNCVYVSKAEGWLVSELSEQHGCYDEIFYRLFREYVPEPHDRVRIVLHKSAKFEKPPGKKSDLFVIDLLSIKNKNARLTPVNQIGANIWWPVDGLEVVPNKTKPERRMKESFSYDRAPWTR